MENRLINSEQSGFAEIPEIQDFSFSTNREGDWPNVICSHTKGEKPTLFNTETKSIVKLKLSKFLKIPKFKNSMII